MREHGRHARIARTASFVLSLTSIATALLVLAGWTASIRLLTSVLPGEATMMPWSAVCVTLLGIGLCLGHDRAKRSSTERATAAACAAAVLLIALVTLGEHITHAAWGPDTWLFRGSVMHADGATPGRMAPPTAVALSLLAGAQLFARRSSPAYLRTAQSMALGAMLIGGVGLAGYLYGVRALYGFAAYSAVSLPSAAVFVALGLASLAVDPEIGVIAPLVGDDVGGVTARRLLPAALLLPFAIGFLRLKGEQAGFYSAQFGLAIFVCTTAALFSVLVWWTARQLAAIDVRRADAAAAAASALGESRRAESELRALTEDLERRVRERTVELEAAKDRAESADRLKTDFIMSMSHELRTPLNAIIGFTGTLLMRLPGPLTDAQAEQLAHVQSSGRQLLALITDVLDVARIEAGEFAMTQAPFDASLLVREVVAELQPLALEQRLDLRADALTTLPLVSDRRAVKQILTNVIGNAIKFTRQGTVVASVERADGELRFVVEDTGIGIAAANLPKLFGKFVRVHDTKNDTVGGTGLGLYLCKSLTERLGGEISLDSTPGVGTRVVVALPAMAGLTIAVVP